MSSSQDISVEHLLTTLKSQEAQARPPSVLPSWLKHEPKLMTGWWFQHFLFSIVYGIILPIDELIFFKMVKTTKIDEH